MTSGAITLVVSGPAPGSVHTDAESATALLRELHARTILHVARPGIDELTGAAEPPGPEPVGDPGGADCPGILVDPTGPDGPGDSARLARLGRKGGIGGPLGELVVTGLFSATTVAALAQVAVAFVQRGAARRIVLRDGRRTLTITAPGEETERMVVEWLGVPPTQSGAESGAD